VVEITVRDGTGAMVAQTRTTAPVSDEIDCAKCHGSDAFNDVLVRHDALHGSSLVAAKPVLCASCHGSPALGQSDRGTAGTYLSQAIHSAHASRGAACYDCHPGEKTQCNRSLPHAGTDGNCTTCHGDLATVGGSQDGDGRVPWATEPKCADCHEGIAEVDTGTALYRQATGHGNLGCPACHGSPHAMHPSREASDDASAVQYQGVATTIGNCAICHRTSRGGGSEDFAEAHGGTSPEHFNACHVCHTSVPSDTAKWPHHYEWKSRTL